MMPLLIRDDGGNCGDGGRVVVLQCRELVFQVPEYDTFNRSGCGCNGAGSTKSGNKSEYSSTQTAEPISAAALPAAAKQLRAKNGAMLLLVRAKFLEFIDHSGRGKTRHENLPAVYVYGAMLARMIDFEDAVAEGFGDCGRAGGFHES